MNIAHVVASLDNAAAGPSYSVLRLSEALSARGQNVELLSTTNASKIVDATERSRLHNRSFVTNLNGWGAQRFAFSRDLRVAIDRAAAGRSVLHSHGLWLMPNFYSAMSAKRHQCVHIISPRGMLAPAALQFSRHRKKLIWMLAQKRAINAATCLHATSPQECDELRELGVEVPVAVIPNGVDLPVYKPKPNAEQSIETNKRRTLLYLGRLHPKKGIDRLITAWASLQVRHPDWRLRLVGPSEDGCRQQLEAQVLSLGLADVLFEDGMFGSKKSAAYQEADLFVLPTLNENFGMVVAEALSHALPVVCTRGAPWRGLETHDCGWWIEQGIKPLIEALDEAMTFSRIALHEKGKRGRDWMAASFSWNNAARDMEQVYRWSVIGGEQPDCLDVLR